MEASNRNAFVIALVWPLIVATALGYWMDRRHAAALIELAETKAEITPIAVIDSVAFMKGSTDGGTPAERAQAGLTLAKQTADRLKNAGYVVLDRNLVVTAPEAVMVRP